MGTRCVIFSVKTKVSEMMRSKFAVSEKAPEILRIVSRYTQVFSDLGASSRTIIAEFSLCN